MPVTEGDHVLGYVDIREVSRIPEAQWHEQQVGQIMHGNESGLNVTPETDAEVAFKKMHLRGLNQLFVIANDRLVGILSQSGLMKYLNLSQI